MGTRFTAKTWTISAGALAMLGMGVVTGSFATEKEKFAVEFALAAGEQEISCHSTPIALGKNQTPSTLKDARFYVHDVQFVRANGETIPVQLEQNEWQYLNLALVDLEDAQGNCGGNKGTHTRITGERVLGDYVGVQFVVGVPVLAPNAEGKPISLNHSNTEQIAAPLDIQAMAWNWQGGRKFMKIELMPEGGVQRANDKIKVWPIHLGSTGCVGNPANGEIVSCSNPNRFPVHLPVFNPNSDKIVLDIHRLFQDSDVSSDGGGAAGCMSSPLDPECPAIFSQLGLRLTPSSAEAKDGGQAIPNISRQIFRREAK